VPGVEPRQLAPRHGVAGHEHHRVGAELGARGPHHVGTSTRRGRHQARVRRQWHAGVEWRGRVLAGVGVVRLDIRLDAC
jgi:hypothetical protein